MQRSEGRLELRGPSCERAQQRMLGAHLAEEAVMLDIDRVEIALAGRVEVEAAGWQNLAARRIVLDADGKAERGIAALGAQQKGCDPRRQGGESRSDPGPGKKKTPPRMMLERPPLPLQCPERRQRLAMNVDGIGQIRSLRYAL